MKIILAGGGTGGHVTPLLAIIDSLKKKNKNIEIAFVGNEGGVAEKLLPQANVPIFTIRSGKFRRYHRNKVLNVVDPTTIIKNAIDLKKFIQGIFDSLRILKKEDPDLAFLKGGYVSLPFGIACRMKRVPYFIHESDVIPGLANKLLLKKAEKIFVSFPESSYKDLPKEQLLYSGTPVRGDVLKGDRKRAYDTFGLNKNLKTILIICGSQGAHGINMLVFGSLGKYLEKYQVIQVAGEYDYDWLKFKTKNINHKERYKLYTFLSGDLKDAYAIADIVITRASNNVWSEISALGKPAVVIPNEISANDHQLENAKIFSREGAAYVMLQSHLEPNKLFNQVDKVLSDEDELKYLSEKITKFYKADSADIIAENLISFYKEILREEGKGEKNIIKKN